MNSLRADLEAAKAVAEDRAAIVSVLEEVHGFELRAALDEAAVLTVRLDAALDEQRVAALSPLIVQDGVIRCAQSWPRPRQRRRKQAGHGKGRRQARCRAQEHRRHRTGSCRGARARAARGGGRG
mmetsp:Transcript_10536/g.24428  ORF Transcript_10536/g.24428 Transcript_10536/m.24428 type:complete len:125 (-) Transcript_10536:359-733(-)